jgi:hypothetical protein
MKRQHVVGIEPEIKAKQPDKAPREQSRACEEHHGRSNLRSHKDGSEARRYGRCRAAFRTLMQPVNQRPLSTLTTVIV